MSATAGQADGVRSLADRFGIEPGMVVMEMGYDDDVDTDLRDALTDRCGRDRGRHTGGRLGERDR